MFALLAKLHAIQVVISEALAGVALIPTIKIGKVEFSICRYDGISHRALEDLLARKRICIRLVGTDFLFDLFRLNRLEMATQCRHYSVMPENDAASVIPHRWIVRCPIQSPAQGFDVGFGIVKMPVARNEV